MVMLGASSEVENLHEWGRACGNVIGIRTLLRYCTCMRGSRSFVNLWSILKHENGTSVFIKLDDFLFLTLLLGILFLSAFCVTVC